MKLQTSIPLSPSAHPIDYNSQVLSVGSCFAEHMGDKLRYYKFRSLQNPLGILFHPLAIERLITDALGKTENAATDVFEHNGLWHTFNAHSSLSHPDKEVLLQRIDQAVLETNEYLTEATHIMITLGTAWVYRHIAKDVVVANCHKVRQQEFTKELLSVMQVASSLERMLKAIQEANPRAKVIFTVSPVRHLKDGFVENQRSKAHLIAAVQALLQTTAYAFASYFCSYELLMDELRDYRFYEADMVHPNALAVTYIWGKFSEVWISDAVKEDMRRVAAVQKGLQHQPFHKNSEAHQQFLKSLQAKITYLKEEYPFMEF